MASLLGTAISCSSRRSWRALVSRCCGAAEAEVDNQLFELELGLDSEVIQKALMATRSGFHSTDSLRLSVPASVRRPAGLPVAERARARNLGSAHGPGAWGSGLPRAFKLTGKLPGPFPANLKCPPQWN